MKSIRVGFAGTPEFAANVLNSLLIEDSGNFSVCMIMTQKPKKSGRGLKLVDSPVSELGQKHNIIVYTPENLCLANQELKKKLKSIDILVVVAYGLLLPLNLLKLPQYGCINIHPSLLPRWRGAAPIQRALEAGDTYTGVCLIQMDPGLDTGPIWAYEKIAIAKKDTYETLEDKLFGISEKLIKNFLHHQIFDPNFILKKQSDCGVTIATKIAKIEGKVDWAEKASIINNKIRAFSLQPGIYSTYGAMRVKLNDSVLLDSDTQLNLEVPGSIVGIIKIKSGQEVLKIICGKGCLGIGKLKKEGGKWISPRDFINNNDFKKSIFFV